MAVRNGIYGEFYYCPNQVSCKQPTVSKSLDSQSATREELNHSSKVCRQLERKMFGEELGIIRNGPINPRQPFMPEYENQYLDDDDDGYVGAF